MNHFPPNLPSATSLRRATIVCAFVVGIFISFAVLSAPAQDGPVLIQPPRIKDAVPPSSRPAAAHPSDKQLARWIADLGNDDPDVRDDAAQAMMAIGRDDLPRLAKLAAAQKGLLPAQIAGMHEVVTQVYLATEPYSTNNTAFIGLRFQSSANNVGSKNVNGLLVTDRIPGFCGYRVLRSGDVIAGITENPILDLSNTQDFVDYIKTLPANHELHLDVSRGEKILHVALTLDARPDNLPFAADDFDAWLKQRVAPADEYWHATFAELEPDARVAATQP